ncbi:MULTISPECIES: NAD(P)/FAD-dependent oxidoreductase [Pseudomonas]|uniref:NAD(P)/FAD-dependent oxidoreductase n=1 Tax=Pseudomonas TaxID=286 RepID=UPI000C07CF92|nr:MULTISPECIES: FAD-dependent oxidoreductase [Pseudomonas]MBH3425092.1 FAD-dependent oxidoreductase [Pseudomonas gessardii]NNA93211.1 FAD-dependent oxidoreductase [Pseudomonas gessardii]PHN63063.1 pyridine nucleotide-disulfide oxidoreductase [Pseudomonas sp. ICMP 8385]
MQPIEVENIDVAIIGGGPSGLSAAITLRKLGVGTVVVIEREPEAGGIPRHCGHPPFGLREYGRVYTGPAYARKNVAQALKAGVQIRVKHAVTQMGPGGRLEVVSPEGAQVIQARRVLIATGARETPRSARLLGGDRPLGVINTGAFQSYLYLEHLKPFERPLIVGTELVSLSAVMSCRRAGIRPVAMIEANPRATARWPLSLYPRLRGVPMHFGAQLLEIHGTGRVEGATVRLADGQTQTFDCDGVLLTGQFIPESSLVRLSELRLDPNSGGPHIDQYGRCSDPVYFAAGNLLRPVETAGWSFREGHKIATMIARDLLGQLPPAAPGIEIACKGDVKLCVPQRLNPSTVAGLQHLQLRVSRGVKGRLVVRADGEEIWARAGSSLPERRILIPIASLNLPQGVQQLEVDFVGQEQDLPRSL